MGGETQLVPRSTVVGRKLLAADALESWMCFVKPRHTSSGRVSSGFTVGFVCGTLCFVCSSGRNKVASSSSIVRGYHLLLDGGPVRVRGTGSLSTIQQFGVFSSSVVYRSTERASRSLARRRRGNLHSFSIQHARTQFAQRREGSWKPTRHLRS